MFLACVIPSAVLYGQTLEPPKTAEMAPYLIQPNDVLQITVYKEPNLSGKALVRPDGRISSPLVQDMQAAGMTPAQLRDKIEKSLKEYLEFPIVTVTVEAIQGYRVYVLGKVAKSGEIVKEGRINVLEALSLAGGLLEFADTANIVIIRNSGEDSTLYRFNYPEVIKGRNFSQNMLLKSGDVVVVP
jgi:polysaccharide export outer membrane protein